jgi:hypothetical protein
MLPPNLDWAFAIELAASNSVNPNVAAHTFLVNVSILSSPLPLKNLRHSAAVITRATFVPRSSGGVADPKCADYCKLRLEDERLPTQFFTDFVCRATQWLTREGG